MARVERTHMKTAELESYQDQLLSIRQDATGLMSGLSDAQFNWQPEPGRWSMSGLLRSPEPVGGQPVHAVHRRGDRHGAGAESQEQRPVRLLGVRALVREDERRAGGHAFQGAQTVQPVPGKPVDEVRAEFLRWQDELGRRLMEADGLDLRRAKHKSPIPLVKWSLGAFFQLMLAHERRHVWQARIVRQNPAFPA